jgi:hypothetical protein
MPKGVMSPVFALLVLFLAIDTVILTAPYYAFRFTDDPWGSAERMEFLAKAMASALAFGFVASLAAERRNYSPWAFLAGHAGFWLAVLLAALDWDLDHGRAAPLLAVAAGFLGCIAVAALTSKPRGSPPPVRGLLLAACRLTGACGNIWFGIALMTAIVAVVGAGTLIETKYSARAAQFLVYRSAWFGAIFFTAGLSMLSATFRKWPFRLEQAGWLTVHTGLALVVIGSMTSFLTKVEGDVRILEGQQVDSFRLSERTRLEVFEAKPDAGGRARWEPLIDAISDFDLNPAETEPARVYQAGKAPVSVTVDRFFATGRRSEIWRDDGTEPRAGIAVDVYLKDETEKATSLQLDEETGAAATLPLPGIRFPVEIHTGPARFFEALARAENPAGHGRVVVSDRAGKVLVEMPVELPPGAETRPARTPAALAAEAPIPGSDVKVRLRGYYDRAASSRDRLYDASPGVPVDPMVLLTFEGPKGADVRQVRAFFDDPLPPPAEMPADRYDYQVTYAFAPAIPLEGPALFFLSVEGLPRFVYASRDGKKTAGVFEVGTAVPLPIPFVRFVPTKFVPRLRVVDEWTLQNYEPSGDQVIRVTPSLDGAPLDPVWLQLGQTQGFAHGDRQFVVRWRTTSRPLGFSLHLHEFHRDFHPGSLQPATFESYLHLVHPTKFPKGEDVKIDMNHPLRLDGWRLFQARFDSGESPRAGEATVLEVNRDPGLAIVYPACAAVLLGLVVVLFMKRTLALLRRKLEREGAPPRRHLLLALASVAAVGIGPAIFSIYVAIRPWLEQQFGILLPLSGWPAFVFGLSFVAVFPMMVVAWFTRTLHQRLAASVAGAPPPAPR